jgi:predicted nucleic acid-binding protein
MAINRETSLFFDASALVAASHSPTGGSALVLAACQVGGFQACTTSAVLIKSQRTLEDFPKRSFDRFHELLANIPWKLLSVPPEAVIERYTQYVDPKDAHVLAAAVEGRADFLLTLDRRHLLAAAVGVQQAGLPIEFLSPGDFIQQYYPQHESYTNLPAPRHGA